MQSDEQSADGVDANAAAAPPSEDAVAGTLRIDGADVPQTDDLGRVRAVLDAIGVGATSTDDVARAVRVSLRHAAYAIRAAVTLDLLGRSAGPLAVTPRGAALARTVPGSAEEATRLREAVTECPVVCAVAPTLLGRRGPSRAVLARQIAKLAAIAPATAERRAQTLLSWRRQLLRGDRRGTKGSAASAVAALAIAPELEAMLWDANPWWRGGREAGVSELRRAALAQLELRFAAGLTPAVVLRGPRQVGKTTLLRQLIARQLEQGADPRRIFRLQLCDLPELRRLRSPVLSLVRWYADRILGCSLEDAAREGRPALVVVDHAHEHPDWAAELRHLVDSTPVRMIVSGDGTLEVPASTHGLAGRVTTLELSMLSLPEVAEFRGLGRLAPWLGFGSVDALGDASGWRALGAHGAQFETVRDAAYCAFVARGGYPLAQARADAPWELVAEHLRESVVERALLHDSVVGAAGERLDRAVLGRLFALACRHAGGRLGHALARAEQVDEALGAIGARRARAALDELAATLVLRIVEADAATADARRSAGVVCIADHALADAWLRRPASLARPSAPDSSDPWGHRPERSLVGYYLASLPGVELCAPSRAVADGEVDYLVRIADRVVPVAIARQAHAVGEAAARARAHLDERRSAATFALVVVVPSVTVVPSDAVADGHLAIESRTGEPLAVESLAGEVETVTDPKLVVLPLSSLLTLR